MSSSSTTSPPPIQSLSLTYSDLSSPTFLKSRNKRAPKAVSWPTAALAITLVPPSLLLLTPLIALSQLMNKFTPPPPATPCLIPSDVSSIPAPVPFADRPYDIVILGATGFTGDLALQYLLKTYSNTDLKLAVAGRNANKLQTKLEAAAAITNTPQSFLKTVGTIVVDTSSPQQLADMCNQTSTLLTTVGPFAIVGTSVIETCALTGTNYCDITGETQWVRENILLCSAAAKHTGAKLVSLCGHDSIPWDLTVHNLAKNLPAGENLVKVTVADDIKGAVSGGTVATMIHGIEGKNSRNLTAGSWFKGDPMNYVTNSGDSNVSTHKTKTVLPFNPFKPVQSPFHPKAKLGFFLMSSVNGDAIKRGVSVNKLGNGNKPLQYTEGLNAPDWKSSVTNSLFTYLSLAVVAAKPIRALLMGGIIPSPGQGPTIKQQQQGYLRVLGEGIGDNGTVVRSCMYFDADPGYKDTSRMLAESAMTLKEGGADGVEGGVYTPGAAMPKMLLERLCKTGTAYGVEVVKK